MHGGGFNTLSLYNTQGAETSARWQLVRIRMRIVQAVRKYTIAPVSKNHRRGSQRVEIAKRQGLHEAVS
jgi:hypothetical protein